MDFSGEVNHILHDINNQLFILNNLIDINSDKLKEASPKFKTCTTMIINRVNTLEMITNDKLNINKELIESNLFSSRLNEILKKVIPIYPDIFTDFELIESSELINYNRIFVEQLIVNILDNSRKSNADIISIKLKNQKEFLDLRVIDNGKPYVSDSSALFKGVGKLIISKISKALNYSVEYRALENGHCVCVQIKKETN